MKYHLIFYMNLMFSALREEDREVILDQCMDPLLKLGEDGYPIAIQMSGLSLEYMAKLRPEHLERLKKLIEDEHCEFIGNGYSQIIQPLAPYEINFKNQELGMQCYESILGLRPKIATVNEMAFSSSSSESFIQTGYTGLIMEWNNPYKTHPDWDESMRFFPQRVNLGKDSEADLIWCDTILFQKFQRYVYGEIELQEYMENLKKFEDKNGALCLYCSDAEVFDFRPPRYGNEVSPGGEWLRIRKLMDAVQSQTEGLIFPSEVIENFKKEGSNLLQLETSLQPIPVKKQDKYNINRWALTGRDDFTLNTRCYRIAEAFLKGAPNDDDWKKLCFVWSSDLRTHIENNRWEQAQFILSELEDKWVNSQKMRKYFVPSPDDAKPFDIESNRYFSIETANQILTLDTKKGLSIKQWSVKGVPLLGTVPHGFFDDISLAADFYSCHSVIEPQGSHKVTDLVQIKPWLAEDEEKHIVGMRLEIKDHVFEKVYEIDKSNNTFSVNQTIQLPKRYRALIRSCYFTLLPGVWDMDSSYYKTALGGKEPERFNFGDTAIDHTQNLNQLVSTRHGLGVTDGEIQIGDANNSIIFKHEPSEAALVPHLQYLPQKNGHYLLRLIYSAQELDETFKPSNKPQIIKHRLLVKADIK